MVMAVAMIVMTIAVMNYFDVGGDQAKVSLRPHNMLTRDEAFPNMTRDHPRHDS